MITTSPHVGPGKPADSFRTVSTDVLIVGSGVAGLAAALECSRIAPRARVIVLTRDSIGGHGASPLAQGGIAAALDPSDSPALHARDTERAASGLAERDLVEILTTQGPARVRELLDLGARFDLDPSGEVSLGLEGAHSRRRIVHADGDRTGAEVTRTLTEAVQHAGSLEIAESTRAVDLFSFEGRVRGVWARGANGALHLYCAQETILATGGPGRTYLRTTAPAGLDGDGMAMAGRAGALLRDIEFMQFHPTALNVPADPLPLVTEALRGAGALLVNRRGGRILEPEEGDELASRDRVARALWLRVRDGDQVFLDAREVFSSSLPQRFPGVHRLCRIHGINPARELIPVTPAAHYHMGGIAVDEAGRTSLGGLWAVGEAAASGVHGANRLASNSLLEGLVFGPRAAQAIMETSAPFGKLSGRELREATAVSHAAKVQAPLPESLVLRIRTLLWEGVGVVRNEEGLTGAVDQLDDIDRRLPYATPPSSRNLLLSARMIAQAALLRKESIGSHYRSDAKPATGRPLRHSGVTLGRDGGNSIVAELETAPGVEATIRTAQPLSVGDRESLPPITAR